MIDTLSLSTAVSFTSGIIGVALVVLAIQGYRRNRDARLGFVAGAFMVFSLKSFLVAYALAVDAAGAGTIGHHTLELVDAVGDLATVFLLMAPIFWPLDDK